MEMNEILALLRGGENISVEFKKSTSDITKDVYETVGSFSNREGGHIFLGVKDNGTVLGIDLNEIDRMRSEFVTTINNSNKCYPPLFLQIETIEIEGKQVLHIYVPVCAQVCRINGRIYDRNEDSDIDITNNSDAVYQAYARKQGTYFVNKVTGFGMDALRPDIIERARKLSRVRRNDHPWLAMNDEEILRSEGLILTDPDRQKEGVTLAGVLLFGTDQTIMSVLPQHKTDAIFRVENLDRYDDRDVIITNLFDSYDRLMAFGAKHLSDPFVLEGIQSISARDKILREIFSNLLAHQDFSSGYVAKFVIEKSRMYTENANQAHGIGTLNLQTFAPFAKNPPISRVFRDAGLADELGSGMRNTYKYTRLYSGQEPQFIEGADVFRTIIPLAAVATGRVGPEVKANHQVNPQVNHQVNPQVSLQVNPQVSEKVLSYCVLPRSKAEIAVHCGYKDRKSFTMHYLKPLLDAGLLLMTIPDKPRSQNQKYVTAQFGEAK